MKESRKLRLIIVGNPEEHHVGAHFLSAARQLGLQATLLDVREAHSRNVWVKRFFHRVLNRRPAHLNRFSQKLVELCRESKPDLLLVTGISAPHIRALKEIGEMGIQRANFLTDDPWNPRNGAVFFWPALREYDVVWSPRRSNLDDLRRHGCRRAEYLPFGYNPTVHFPEAPQTAGERERFSCDVVFVGGADADRLPVARALVRAGFNVHLYGGYWDRDAELRQHWRGFVHGRELRMAVGGATVNICLGRKANRDGHAMRSLELPAMGACMIVEDTPEHRELYGDEEDCVEYYSNIEEMVDKVRALCARPEHARLLGSRVFTRICHQSRHTYADRLRCILY
jgi:glycosyltransferase involved in cell wall biosynthesis